MTRFGRLFSSEWDKSIPYQYSLRFSELVFRLWWFIGLRWTLAASCIIGAVAAYFHWVPLQINFAYPLAVAVLLIVGNVIFTWLTLRFTKHELNILGIRFMILAQTLTDFIALSVISYALGGIETPILVLYLGEIILVTLFCTRITSFLMTLVGVGFAALPLLLEYTGTIDPVSIYASALKTELSTDLRFTTTYVIGITAFFLFFWYLVSEVTTSLRLREHELEQAYEKLALMDREKSQATLRATHELKAPLAAINSYVYALRDGYAGEISAPARKALVRIGERANFLMQKIVDIIHLSNLKTLMVKEAEFRPLNLSQLLTEAVAQARVIDQQRNIRLNLQDEQSSPRQICGSEKHLHTLFSNLLCNAIHYSHDGTEVKILLREEGSNVIVSIIDQGIGIPEQNLDRIFDEHFRSNNAAAHYDSGTGLGLPIVKEIARLHRAELKVSSKVGQGTRFDVIFQLYQPNHQEGTSDGQDTDH